CEFVLGTGSTLTKNDALPAVPAEEKSRGRRLQSLPCPIARQAARDVTGSLAELDALEGGIIHLRRLFLVGGGQLRLVLVPEVFALGGGLGCAAGRLIGAGVFRTGQSCAVLPGLDRLGRPVGGVLGQAAEGLLLASVHDTLLGHEPGYLS